MDLGYELAVEIARRTAQRLELLAAERPDVLAERLTESDSEHLRDLLDLTRLPPPLADREPSRRRVGVCGKDHCTGQLVIAGGRHAAIHQVDPGELDPAELADEDLIAAHRHFPDTLPGYWLG